MITAECNKQDYFTYNTSDNETPPISRVLIGRDLTDNETPFISRVLIDRPIFSVNDVTTVL